MIRFTDEELEWGDLQRKEHLEEPGREHGIVRDIDGAKITARPSAHRPGLLTLTVNGKESHLDRDNVWALIEDLRGVALGLRKETDQ